MTNFFDRIVNEQADQPNAEGDAGDVPNNAADKLLSPDLNSDEGNDAGGADGSIEASNTSRTPSEVKIATQELLKHGYLEESRDANLFRSAITHEREINATLEPLDLVLRLDSARGVAYLAVAEAAKESSDSDEGWTHPLVRRQRLTLEQSLLVALLRAAFVLHEQNSGVGHSPATIAVDELLPRFTAYFDESGSDRKDESRLMNLLDQLKTYGIVSEVDKKQEVTIRPLIAHLANPESLMALLAVLQSQHPTDVAEKTKTGVGPGEQ